MEIKLGYCCVSMLHPDLKCSRCTTKTYLDSHDSVYGHDYLMKKAKANLTDLAQLLVENQKNNILAYRVPEQLLPQIDLGYYEVEALDTELKAVGKIANEYKIQLSTHPSQYFVLNSLKEVVVTRTIRSLDLMAEAFERMALCHTPNIVLHVGGRKGYETKKEALMAFASHYERLSETAKRYLVVENDQASFTISDCLLLHEQIGIPVVLDSSHYRWNPGDLTLEKAVGKVVKTWGIRIPKFHLSTDKDQKKHAHSDYIDPKDYNLLVEALDKTNLQSCYIMLECKEKDRAILKLREDLKAMT